MNPISIQVDVTNPGQFFACCGLLELAHRLWPDARVEGRFGEDEFHVSCPDANVLQIIIEKLAKRNISFDESRGDKATHPIDINDFDITLEWWIDSFSNKTPLKLWAGQLTSSMIVQKLCESLADLKSNDPFNESLPLSSRFGVDPRSAWNTLNVGFSPNDQNMEVATYSFVEILAAFGLQTFRPKMAKRQFIYCIWYDALPTIIARAASSNLINNIEIKSFQFGISPRGSNKGFNFSTQYMENNND